MQTDWVVKIAKLLESYLVLGQINEMIMASDAFEYF